jgi:hypothetical protein
VLQEKGSDQVEVELICGKPNVSEEAVNVLLFVDDEISDSATLKDNDWHTVRFKLPPCDSPKVRHLKFLTTPTWSPKDFGNPDDDREIGIGVRRISTRVDSKK